MVNITTVVVSDNVGLGNVETCSCKLTLKLMYHHTFKKVTK